MEITYKKDWRTPTAIGVGSFLVGAGVGYFIAKRRLETEFVHEVVEDTIIELEGDTDDLMDQTSAEAFKKFAKAAREAAKGERDDQEKRKALEDRLTMDSTADSVRDSVPTEPLEPYVQAPKDDPFMDEPTPGWNQAEEEEERTTYAPYVLHEEEFAQNQRNYHQATLTYYAGDNILTDENDIPIYDPSKIVGQLAFGHGSNNPNMVYIRNDKNKAEYAVVREEGSYQTTILGIEVQDEADSQDLKHSNRVLKFRMD